MKKTTWKLSISIVLVLVSCMNPMLSAKEYHVSKTGSNSNSGSETEPLLTISKAAKLATPGDTITVHEGIYREWVKPIRGGESDTKRIVYRAAPGEKVEIKGSEVITGWEELMDGVWKVTIPNTFFGDYNPAGRLPVTFYKSIEQLPDFRNYSMEGRTYRYFRDTPLYSFGFGLSYTKFRYSNLKFSKGNLDVSETLEVEAEIENIGEYRGDEVVQLYVSRKNTRFRVPIRELKGFTRVFLKKGQKKKISFKLIPKDFSVVNLDGERLLEPGIITISIGGCQPGYNLDKEGLVMKDVSIIGKAKHLE